MLAQKSGAALLTVLIAMMIISLMLFEFQYSAMVERKLAYNDLNQLQAYYLAKAGARMGLLRIALYARLRGDKNIQDLKKKGMDFTTYLDQIWSLPLPAFPPDKAKIGELLSSDKAAAEKTLEETKVSEGRVTHTITSESSKINLNYLQVPANQQNQRIDFRSQPQTMFQYVGVMLINVLQNFLDESEDAFKEFDNMKPEEVVMNIMDWVSPGTISLNGGAKDAFYETQKPPYKSKKNRFYTVDELKLVKGIDDHLFSKLKPLVTVYSYDGKINLNTAGRGVYKALYRDFSDDDVKRILEERDRRGGWTDVKAFVEYVSNDLNRTNFKTYYSNEKEYPFAVGSQSFLVESLGQINKSKSTVQRVIRIGVALTQNRGGQVTKDGNPATCNGTDPAASPTFWDARSNQCKTKPRNQNECVNVVLGTWMEKTPGSGIFGCRVLNNAPMPSVFLEPPKGGAGAGEPNAMKIMYWSET